jgi:hypothetical protein
LGVVGGLGERERKGWRCARLMADAERGGRQRALWGALEVRELAGGGDKAGGAAGSGTCRCAPAARWAWRAA